MSIDVKILLERAKEAHENKQYLSEIDLLDRVLSLSTSEIEKATILDKIGNSFYLLDRNDKAKKYYLLALETISNLSSNETLDLTCSINNSLGAVFFDEGDYHEALSRKLIALQCIDSFCNEDAFLLLTAIGVNYEKIEQYKEAILFYKKALETPNIDKNDIAMVYSYIGQCYDRSADNGKAFEYFQKTFDIAPDYENGWYFIYRFAELAYEFCNYKLSQKYFLKTFSKIPSSEKNYLKECKKYLGYNYLATGSYKNALSEFEGILILKPDSVWRGIAYAGIAQANLSMGKNKATLHAALKALGEELSDASKERIYFMLVKTHLRREEMMMADTCFQKLYQLNPRSEYLKQLYKFDNRLKKTLKKIKDTKGTKKKE